MFFPRGFTKTGRWPAVVVGHGINALSIGLEKYGARIADRGLVAMAIDYQSYGFSGQRFRRSAAARSGYHDRRADGDRQITAACW